MNAKSTMMKPPLYPSYAGSNDLDSESEYHFSPGCDTLSTSALSVHPIRMESKCTQFFLSPYVFRVDFEYSRRFFGHAHFVWSIQYQEGYQEGINLNPNRHWSGHWYLTSAAVTFVGCNYHPCWLQLLAQIEALALTSHSRTPKL